MSLSEGEQKLKGYDKMLGKMLENVRKAKPLVHNITNYVTVNDCANALLAAGGSPIMADAVGEVEEITSICSALNINIGTLNENTIKAMLLAGKKANELSRPVILDPVGAGASALRTNTAYELLREIKLDVIRGNMSEIKTLAAGRGTTRGVDADVADAISEENIDDAVEFIKNLSAKTGAVIAVTGAIDIVSDSKRAYVIRNGRAEMSSVTGTGCMLSAICAAFVAANRQNILDAVAAAVCAMGLCGEIAYKKMDEGDGNSSYRNYIIDAIYNLDGESLREGAKYEIR